MEFIPVTEIWNLKSFSSKSYILQRLCFKPIVSVPLGSNPSEFLPFSGANFTDAPPPELFKTLPDRAVCEDTNASLIGRKVDFTLPASKVQTNGLLAVTASDHMSFHLHTLPMCHLSPN